EGDFVEISFADTGCGIARNILGKLFDPFFTTKTEGNGTGLGLSISHEIIQNHGGKISVESQEGKGTTFIIDLPC
ncbi:MAG: HAMP domain-containing histidine kinase, partial [Candidatus Scalindua sp.]|nr:HAMP domain-containing histidine kinase [Candidatus Scalindua sp.]